MAPVKPINTKFAIGKDLDTGSVSMTEYGPGVKGQISFQDIDMDFKQEIDVETGEIKESKVIDLQRKQA